MNTCYEGLASHRSAGFSKRLHGKFFAYHQLSVRGVECECPGKSIATSTKSITLEHWQPAEVNDLPASLGSVLGQSAWNLRKIKPDAEELARDL